MYEWNILFYTFTDNELEIGSFKDLAKLTSLDHDNSSIVVSGLVDTASLGTYLYRIAGSAYQLDNIRMTRLPSVNMSCESTLIHFLRHSTATAAKRTALILGGHGSGWFLRTEKDSALAPRTLAYCIESAGLYLDLLCFDNCLMANLETMYEVHSVARYVTAYEDYAGWKGIVEPCMLEIFTHDEYSTKEIAIRLSQNLLQAQGPEDDPTDVAVLNLAGLDSLVDTVKDLPLTKPINSSFCIDPDYWYLQDFYSIAQHSNLANWDSFVAAFNEVVVWYRQSNKKNNPNHHGMSCIVDIENVTEDPDETWRLLELRLRYA